MVNNLKLVSIFAKSSGVFFSFSKMCLNNKDFIRSLVRNFLKSLIRTPYTGTVSFGSATLGSALAGCALFTREVYRLENTFLHKWYLRFREFCEQPCFQHFAQHLNPLEQRTLQQIRTIPA